MITKKAKMRHHVIVRMKERLALVEVLSASQVLQKLAERKLQTSKELLIESVFPHSIAG